MPARLHHEPIVHRDTTPTRWLALTHGIYGAGTNWRTIARKLTERRPEWGVLLVDLRQHGRSESGAPPHTIAACADDVRALVEQVNAQGDEGTIEALAGHSFGGKVMLAARPLVRVRQTWLLDSSPSRRDLADDRDDSVIQVLEMLERLPRTWATRDAFIEAVLEAGHDTMLAQWLAMNIVPDEQTGEPTLRLDPVALRALLMDYYATDLWASARDPAAGEVELVIADRSSVFSAADRAGLATLPPHVHAHHIDAGHWLHIQAPGPVVELLATRLP